MNSRRVPVTLAGLALLSLALGGCSHDPNMPKLGRVYGKVTYNGKPVGSGHVVFTPAAGKGGDTGQTASGDIESNGSYELTTFKSGDGAILGEHVVSVEVREGDMPQPKADSTIQYVLPKSVIPTKYSSPDTSPLRYTVKEGSNSFDIDLKD